MHPLPNAGNTSGCCSFSMTDGCTRISAEFRSKIESTSVNLEPNGQGRGPYTSVPGVSAKMRKQAMWFPDSSYLRQCHIFLD